MKSFKQFIIETIPKPGKSSGSPTLWKKGSNVITKEMTLNDIFTSKDIIQSTIPYYKDVVEIYDEPENSEDKSWDVYVKVLEYANYLLKNPNSTKKLKPLQFVDNGLADGAHRISTIYLLQQRLDPKNPFWKNLKLRVEFGKSKDDISR